MPEPTYTLSEIRERLLSDEAKRAVAGELWWSSAENRTQRVLDALLDAFSDHSEPEGGRGWPPVTLIRGRPYTQFSRVGPLVEDTARAIYPEETWERRRYVPATPNQNTGSEGGDAS